MRRCLALLAVLSFSFLPACGGSDDSGSSPTPVDFSATASPEKITPTYPPNEKLWSFTVTLRNGTAETLVLDGYDQTIYDTDTGYTGSKSLASGWPYLGANVAPGGTFFMGDPHIDLKGADVGVVYNSGKARRTYKAHGKSSGRPFQAEVIVELLR